jgi:5-(carboxyamino)imidazole ribonucleotide synthase
VQRISSIDDLEKAFDAPGVLEKAVPFEKEIAVIVARSENGEVATFPTVEMVFHPEHNLVEYLYAPAQLDKEVNSQAQQLAKKTAETLGIVGLLAVEMFVTKDKKVLINEVAPRPHNSGHHTIRANVTSQYEQHWRAILGLPLGNTHAYGPAAMVNLLGEEGYKGPAVYEGMDKLLATSQVFPFLYGKTETRPFRKMGHVTIMDNDLMSLQGKVQFVRESIRVFSRNKE